ncbi:MAG TPA: histone deacetylase, partial [Candidatus Obscuribacter sp.]|nr:histone deacetylase [Candidatus Obscuribacter sp.]
IALAILTGMTTFSTDSDCRGGSDPSQNPNQKGFADTRRHLVFHPQYQTDLPAYGLSQPFALDRGAMVLRRLAMELGQTPAYEAPRPLERSQVTRVHTEAYLESLSQSSTWLEIFELKEELDALGRLPGAVKPFHTILDDFLLKAGGTLLSARKAIADGMCANLGGGYHHAFPDQGRGFCAINDVAITVHEILREKLAERVMVVDVDFHQGDGTARCLSGRKDVFTFSIHSHEGWPEEKSVSSKDIAVAEKDQARYLEMLQEGLAASVQEFQPDFVLLVDGSDAYEKDVLPGTKFLKLPLSVMQKRSEYIIDLFAERKIPLSLVFAGGYGPDVWEVHYHTVRQLLARSGVTFGAAARIT